MTDFEKELKNYVKRVRRLLLVKTDAAAQFLSELENNIADYAEAENITDISKIEARFGTPEAIAKEFFANTDIEAVRRKLALRRVIVAVLIAALLLWGIALTALYIEGHNDMGGSFGEETVIEAGDRL